MVGVIRRNTLQQREICLFQRPAIVFGNLVPNVLNIIRVKFGVLHLDLEQMPVGQASAKFGEDAVLVVAPDFHSGHHVVVIQLAELVEGEIAVLVVLERLLVFQEERQGLGAGQVALLAEHLGAFQHLHQRVFRAQHGLVHIHLPIHDAPRHQETFHGIDTLRLDSEFIPNDFHHFQQSLCIHAALCNTAEETVALQIVDAVHVQLTGNEFAKKAFFVFSLE